MSAVFSNARAFFRTKMNTLRFKEWKDGFNFENIPSGVLNNSYHIDANVGQRKGEYGQLDQEFEQEVVIRLFKKGYKNPAEAIDDCLTSLDTIVEAVLDNEVRLGCNIKNIYLDNYLIRPIDLSNDNVAVLEITFSCLLIISLK